MNVAGSARYKEWMTRGLERTRDLGMVLGPLHPLVAENIARLKTISGLDEVSFHMSGTEAVMAAVRLARFNTGRKLIVCFSGAYHGWWDGVQPGLGSERAIGDCLTLKDLHPASLDVIRRRAGEIAGVLVNPVQSFHPNAPPPNDAILLTSDARKTTDGSAAYGEWLRRLRAICAEARRAAHLRRGLHRIPPRPGRSAGVLRGPRRHGRVRQDGRRRVPDRRGLRDEGADAAVRSRATDARRVRGRHVLGAPGRDGRDERVPALAGRPRDGVALATR